MLLSSSCDFTKVSNKIKSLYTCKFLYYSSYIIINRYLTRELEAGALRSCSIHGTTPPPGVGFHLGDELNGGNLEDHLEDVLCKESHPWHHCPEVHKAIDGVRFIADHTRREEDSTRVSSNYIFVSLDTKPFLNLKK